MRWKYFSVFVILEDALVLVVSALERRDVCLGLKTLEVPLFELYRIDKCSLVTSLV